MDVINYFESNKKNFLEELKDLVRIPSVSFEGFPKENLRKSAEHVAQIFKKYGLENVEILKPFSDAHPYVYADWLHAKDKPTLLLYAHHDVQPAGRLSHWKTNPFDPVEKDGRLWGRGTADDKAGILVHLAAIASYLKTRGSLPVNVKLIIEGEEESGSAHLEDFLNLYKEKLKADILVLTDTQNYDVGVPALTTSLRGLITFDITLKALHSPKHSGMFGGPTPDVAMALVKLLASMTDEFNRLQIPKIWDEVLEVTKEEEKAYDELKLTNSMFRYQAGLIESAHLLPSRSGEVKPLIQIWREPSLTINAIEVSSKKEVSNSIMDSAWARFGVRLASNMNPQKTAILIEEHLKLNVPWGCELELKVDIGGGAWSIDPFDAKNCDVYEKAVDSLHRGYGVKPVFIGCGGSIPFVKPLVEILKGAPVLLIGVEDPYTNAHSENESMNIDDFYSAIKSMIYFFSKF